MPTPRPRRTVIAGARAHFANVVGEVLNVSSTGALVRAEHRHEPGTEWPLRLECGDATIPVIARVVRCQPVAGPLKSSTGKYTLALTFINVSEEAGARLDAVCKAGRRTEAAPRGLHVSLTRRCPKCKSRDVAKEGRRHYSCGQCGQVFSGMRVGPLRFAR
jgi:hypothetical protein